MGHRKHSQQPNRLLFRQPETTATGDIITVTVIIATTRHYLSDHQWNLLGMKRGHEMTKKEKNQQ